jgi:hypothetical protein
MELTSTMEPLLPLKSKRTVGSQAKDIWGKAFTLLRLPLKSKRTVGSQAKDIWGKALTLLQE